MMSGDHMNRIVADEERMKREASEAKVAEQARNEATIATLEERVAAVRAALNMSTK
jgi:hypothetical protein